MTSPLGSASRSSFGYQPGTKRLAVIGDSLAFTDDSGPQLPDAPQLYPNRIVAALANATGRPWSVSIIARPGADVRDAWRWLAKDRHTQFELIAPADAIVVAIGSFDHAPFGTPAWLESLVPFVRPDAVRRQVRAVVHAMQPAMAAALRSRGARTPETEFVRLYRLVLRQAIGLTRGESAGVALGPTSHPGGGTYGPGHPLRGAREGLQARLAIEAGFPIVQPWPLVEPHAARLNADGIHWPAEAHAAVAGALAAPLIEQLAGARPRPLLRAG